MVAPYKGLAKNTAPYFQCINIVYSQPVFIILAHVHYRKFATGGGHLTRFVYIGDLGIARNLWLQGGADNRGAEGVGEGYREGTPSISRLGVLEERRKSKAKVINA